MDYNNQNANQDMGMEIGWEDEISQESNFVLLDEGDYDFTVTSFERKRYPGGPNMCACNMAVLHLKVGDANVLDNLYLNKKAEWRMSQFFLAIGQKKKGVPCKPNWNAVPGSRGRCKIGIREWTARNGETRQSNEVREYYEPDPNAAPTQGTYQAPAQTPWNKPPQTVSQTAYGQQQTMNGYPTGNPGHWQAGKF